ncbi:hypothetical protein BCR44DRAFT_81122 [Catenaria anguillulae PL171]|uniref:Uncharacterized protein n=1 Tax=Catenaria anguillulae PL171 TaxID=765915 RepID=A0A1Y2HWA5_9FUNG|nr:hypothetical protein BCR44DRAFT_81122 [Catenaria anguillulae PL171]
MTPFTHQNTFHTPAAGTSAATSSEDVDMTPVDDQHDVHGSSNHALDAAHGSINLTDPERTLPLSAPANPPPFASVSGSDTSAFALRQPSKRRTRDDDTDHGDWGPSPVLPKMVRDGTRKPRRVTTEEIHSRTLEKLFRAARFSAPNAPASAGNAQTSSSPLALPKPTLLLVPAACAHCHAVITSLIEGLPDESLHAAAAYQQSQQQPQHHLAPASSGCAAAGIGSPTHSQSMRGAGAKCTSCDRQYCVPCMRSCDRCDEPTCIECYMTLYDDRGQQTVCWTCGHHQ